MADLDNMESNLNREECVRGYHVQAQHSNGLVWLYADAIGVAVANNYTGLYAVGARQFSYVKNYILYAAGVHSTHMLWLDDKYIEELKLLGIPPVLLTLNSIGPIKKALSKISYNDCLKLSWVRVTYTKQQLEYYTTVCNLQQLNV